MDSFFRFALLCSSSSDLHSQNFHHPRAPPSTNTFHHRNDHEIDLILPFEGLAPPPSPRPPCLAQVSNAQALKLNSNPPRHRNSAPKRLAIPSNHYIQQAGIWFSTCRCIGCASVCSKTVCLSPGGVDAQNGDLTHNNSSTEREAKHEKVLFKRKPFSLISTPPNIADNAEVGLIVLHDICIDQ